MIALVDTNVVLDVMLGREPHLLDSAAVLAAIGTSRCTGLLTTTTVTTIHYITGRHIGSEAALTQISQLFSLFGVASVNQAVLGSGPGLGMPDFEDAVLNEARSRQERIASSREMSMTSRWRKFPSTLLPSSLPTSP